MKKCLWFIFLLLIPTQLGKHFWPGWANVQGVRVDYLAPTLYLLDIVFLVLAAVNFKINFKDKWKFLILFFLILLNLIAAQNRFEAGYKILRIMELGWVYFYVRKNIDLTWSFLKKVVPIWIILESCLGLIQVFYGSSVNGLFYWLGERSIDLNTLGVAKWSIMGSEYLRAYGTFSHPNSLAGFLLVGLILWFFFKEKYYSKSVYWWIVFWLGILGMIICGSRNVWLTGIILLFLGLAKKNKIYIGGIVLVAGVIGWKLNLFSGWDPTSFRKRWDLIVAAVLMIKDSVFLGVGAGNFLVRLPEYKPSSPIFWLQPVHNVYLLIISELGVLGTMGLVWWSEIKKIHVLKYWPVMAILITGMFDHYWVTLPQNMWLLVLVFGLASNLKVK